MSKAQPYEGLSLYNLTYRSRIPLLLGFSYAKIKLTMCILYS